MTDAPKGPSPPRLTGKQQRHLRSLAHELSPIVMVGHAGVTEAVLAATSQALEDHELIKVKVQNTLDTPVAEVGTALAGGTAAAYVQKIGRMVVLYRPRKEDPRITLA